MSKIPADKLYREPPPIPTSGGLGHKVAETFARAVARARDYLTEWFEDRLVNFAVDILERIETDLAPLLRPMVDKVRSAEGIPPELQPLLQEISHPTHQGIGALMGGLASTTASAGLGTVLNAFFAEAGYWANRQTYPARIDLQSALVLIWRYPEIAERILSDLQDQGLSGQRIIDLSRLVRTFPDPASVQEAVRRGILSEDYARELFRLQGELPDDAQVMVDLANQVMPADAIRQLYLRGLYTEDKHDSELSVLGYSAGQIASIKRLYQIIPPVQDIITMAVREVFSPEQVAELTLDADFPSEFGEWAQKQGLSADWAHKYWQAHWQLPSPQMGYDMLQRGIIDHEQLANLLKALDYAPVWRDKLIQLSYSPYTRVDVRRMYQLGILDQSQVMRSYMDLGYDEEHATNLTLFTVMGASSDEKDLTKADVLGGYKDGILYREDAKQQLINMGYDDNESEFYLTRQDVDKAAELRKDKIEEVHQLVLRRVYIEDQARNALASQGLTALEIASYIDKWLRELRSRQANYSRADVEQMYKLGMQSSANSEILLQSLDYPAAIAQQIVAIWDTEMALAAEEQSKTKYRIPSNTEVKKLLWQGLITPTKAQEMLEARLYSGETIQLYLASWQQELEEVQAREQEARAKADQAAIRKPTLSEVRTLWLEGIIDDSTRDTLVSDLGIPETVREYYKALWTKQLAAIQAASASGTEVSTEIKPKALSTSQAKDLYVSGIIEESAVQAILTTNGYSDVDQQRLLTLWSSDRERVATSSEERAARSEAIPARNLTLSQLKDLYTKQIISQIEVANGLAQLDYSEEDIINILYSWQTPAEE